MDTNAVRTNARALVRTRVAGWVAPAAANRVVLPSGVFATLPGQGGVVTGIALGDRAGGDSAGGDSAGGWVGDHVEPGVSIAHADPAANQALRRLCCVGNGAVMLDGPAKGARGVVSGKHGAVLAMFAAADLARIAPGERVAIDSHGVGLAIDGEPDIACHSCGPGLFARWITERARDGRLVVPVAAILPAQAAAAGIGMPAAMFNLDLNTSQPPVAELAHDLRFGDIVAVLDQDHRWSRRPAAGWIAVGVVSHGQAGAGGHGFGMMTLLTGRASRLALVRSDAASLTRLIDWRE